ncbi:transcriptional repressor [Mangrovactinospora gilvigrisea]|uniref:Transcriptional repressor n=1 Tax=Mangrovactinospora gilvigrisea TaxID=1428644 RepID=A0A1J7BET8_9ACTN|nr:Fur family transcriptional regulator [Mangrovactinospora gilvigrisea]OIV37215.1 transcriptional repressor [Mangrovactinospora gilvigrisea]
MSDLLERLRGRGWRLTAQRRVVAEVLDSGEHVHLTADEVHGRAAARLPEISRATVYNTLGELVSLGEVLEFSADGRAKRYDPNARHAHQHLVCSGCGSIRDVHIAGDPMGALPESESAGYALEGVEMTFRGLCPDCRAKRGA